MPGTRESGINPKWFQKTFGFVEKLYRETKEQFAFDPSRNLLTVKATGAEFHTGIFQLQSLDELRKRSEAAGSPAVDGHGLTFQNLVGNTQELHMQNSDAVFQVASLFNCLQMRDPNVKPEDGVTGYATDATQGPACAIACPGATVYRNYFVNGEGQLRRQVDCLSGVAELLRNEKEGYWAMKNGYCMPKPPGKIAELNKRLDRDNVLEDDVRLAVQVGIQWDAEVHGGTHSVTQVFCSTVPVAFTKMVKVKDWETFACALLDGAYDATLSVAAVLAAQRKERVPVFLTVVGGGALGNRTKWIMKAIDKALTTHKDAALDVSLVHFASAGHFEELEVGRTPPQPCTVVKSITDEVDFITSTLGSLCDFRRRGSARGLDVDVDAKEEHEYDSDSKQIMKAFAFFDSNGDGVIERQELQDVLQSLDDVLFTDTVIDQLLKEADADGDGLVHYTEFVTWICDGDSLISSRVLATASLGDFTGDGMVEDPFLPPTPAAMPKAKPAPQAEKRRGRLLP
mmetsp:Transcript_130154/g.278130  ORF Transcript_130154/g.278130 Transcript_130154/m.278130 type:complete len:513 (+) Transcript_130154:76-1614(+)